MKKKKKKKEDIFLVGLGKGINGKISKKVQKTLLQIKWNFST